MRKCKGCGNEYVSDDGLAGSGDGSKADEFMVFDGKMMRYVCPLCGGLIYTTDELETLTAEQKKAA
jgi:rubredoxin